MLTRRAVLRLTTGRRGAGAARGLTTGSRKAATMKTELYESAFAEVKQAALA